MIFKFVAKGHCEQGMTVRVVVDKGERLWKNCRVLNVGGKLPVLTPCNKSMPLSLKINI